MILIISQPKAGTYLCANLLQEFGFKFNGMHISNKHFEKYDLSNLDDSRKNPLSYQHQNDLKNTLRLLDENEIAVSHFPPKKQLCKLFCSIKKVYLTRNYEERLNSYRRWLEKTSRPNKIPKNMSEKFHTYQNQWLLEGNLFHLEFNDMIHCNVNKIDGLQKFLFSEIKYDSLKSITRAKNSPSLTKI